MKEKLKIAGCVFRIICYYVTLLCGAMMLWYKMAKEDIKYTIEEDFD